MHCYYSACVKKSRQSESGIIPINIPQNVHEYGPITALLTDAAVQMSSTVKKRKKKKKKMAMKYPPVSSSAPEL